MSLKSRKHLTDLMREKYPKRKFTAITDRDGTTTLCCDALMDDEEFEAVKQYIADNKIDVRVDRMIF